MTDRAAVTTTMILQVVREAQLAWLRDQAVRAEIETLLRGEFADVARTTLNEIRNSE
jgi:hypothetical protein